MLTLFAKIVFPILGLVLSAGMLYSAYEEAKENGKSKKEALLAVGYAAAFIVYAVGLIYLIWDIPMEKLVPGQV